MTDPAAPESAAPRPRVASGPPEPRASAAALRVRRLIVAGFRRLRPASDMLPSRAQALGAVAGLMATAFMMIRLFVPSTVGMADTGIGHRLLCGLGLANQRPFDYDAFTGYIHPRWNSATWFGEACEPSTDIPPFSAHFAMVRLAQLLTGLLGGEGAFDTRAFAVVASVLFGILIGLLVVFLPGSGPFRLAVAAGVSIVMADGVFADFFVSAFSEGTVLLAVLASVVAILVFWRSLTARPVALVLATVLACAAVTVSPLMLAMVPAFLVALLHQRRPAPRGGVHRPSARVGRGRLLARAVVLRAPTVVAAVLIVAVAAMQLVFLANRNNVEYLYTVVFQVITPTSESPEDDVAWFGLPENAAAASGSFYGSEVSRQVLDEGFADTVTVPSVAWFFVTHPERLVGMSDRGFLALASPGLDYLGSYLPDSGHEEGDKEHRLPVVEFVAGLFKAIPLLIPGLHLFALILGLALTLRRGASAAYRAVGGVLVVLIPASWLMFWTIVFGAQPELSRNLLPVTLISALSVPFAGAAVLLLAASGRQLPKSITRDPMPKKARTAASARSLASPSP